MPMQFNGWASERIFARAELHYQWTPCVSRKSELTLEWIRAGEAPLPTHNCFSVFALRQSIGPHFIGAKPLSNQRKIPSGRVFHQPQSPPQISADCLAHISMLVRQLPWTVTCASHSRGLESQFLANLPHGHWGDHSSSTMIFNHPNALDN